MSVQQRSFLAETQFLDIGHDAVRTFAAEAIGDARTDRDKAVRLFAAVRDGVWYDPYTVSEDPGHYRASFVLETGRAYCVPKAVLLTAVCRAAGIPSRLGFADVRNHLQTKALRERMGDTDLFVYHGYCTIHVGGRWLKATPAFNAELCSRFGISPVEFDGERDALMPAVTPDGTPHMEYVRERGVFDDLPLAEILAALRSTYGPPMTRAAGLVDDAFI